MIEKFCHFGTPMIKRISILVCLTFVAVTFLFAAEHTSDSLSRVKENLQEEDAVLVDVREKSEWDRGHIEDAVLAPLSKLSNGEKTEQLEKIPKSKIIYVHCARGVRALRAGTILKEEGYDVRPLKAGYEELIKNGFPKTTD